MSVPGAGIRRRGPVCCLLAILVSSSIAFGWGNDGHMAINKTAAQHVPKDMPDFFRRAADRLTYLGPEPDRWREPSEAALKYAQEPEHYIDLERVADLAEFPPSRFDFYRWLYQKRALAGAQADDYLPERVGLQPYITMETYDRLKVAFREYRRLRRERRPSKAAEQNAIFYAGCLGHYVGDAANPLHTTIHFNGWLGPNPKGYATAKEIHWSFEGAFVSRNIARLGFGDLVGRPQLLGDPFRQYVDYIRDSHKLVERVYEIEKARGLEGAGSAEAIGFVRHRLAAGAQMLLNLWYTAWVESAKPLPPRIVQPKPAD